MELLISDRLCVWSLLAIHFLGALLPSIYIRVPSTKDLCLLSESGTRISRQPTEPYFQRDRFFHMIVPMKFIVSVAQSFCTARFHLDTI